MLARDLQSTEIYTFAIYWKPEVQRMLQLITHLYENKCLACYSNNNQVNLENCRENMYGQIA